MIANDKETQNQCVLAVQVGNTTTSLGLFENSSFTSPLRWDITTSLYRTPDEIRLVLSQLIKDDVFKISGVIISSVVPQFTSAWIEAASFYSPMRPLLVGPGLKTGVSLRYNDPAGLGSDRVAAIVAISSTQMPAVSVTFGTSTTIEVLDEAGVYVGGVIAPGTQISAQAMSQAAAQLSEVGLVFPRSVMGKNTSESLQSGVMLGELCRVEGLIALIEQELQRKVHITFSGENAELFSAVSQREVQVRKNLVLEGLYKLYDLNKAKLKPTQ